MLLQSNWLISLSTEKIIKYTNVLESINNYIWDIYKTIITLDQPHPTPLPSKKPKPYETVTNKIDEIINCYYHVY